MQDGIYRIHFSTPNDSGEGIVAIKNGVVNGGDHGYVYFGSFTSTGDALAGEMTVTRWNPGTVSVFGTIENFVLKLSGSSSEGSFKVTGGTAAFPGASITIAGKRLSAGA